MEIITKSAKETYKLGQDFANNLKEGKTIALFGDLGSGKTTFIQGLAFGFGIKERILSPTFVLMRQYAIRKTENAKRVTSCVSRLYHVDLYRIENKDDLGGLGLQDLWSDPKNIVAIEWPEKIEKILPKKRINIYFEYVENDKRRIIING